MPQPLRIALLLFVAAGALGLIVYGLARAFRGSENPSGLAVKWIVTLIVGAALFWFARRSLKVSGAGFVDGAFIAGKVVFACLTGGILLSVLWAPSIGQFLFGSIFSVFDGGSDPPDLQPLYSIAEALRRRGKFREAIYAIQEQLQKFPADFTGQMMLAEIQAESLNNLTAAEIAIHRICEQAHSGPNIAYALSTLADWHLKYAQDAEAAKNALQKIIELLPNTEFERTASQRIAHLADPDVLVRFREPERMVLKHGVEYLGLLKDQSHLMRKETSPGDQAKELVAHLDAHPLDREARERLAVIYAQEYGRLDFATEQLEQLIALPDESPKHVARWLNLLADLQVQTTNKTELAEQTLRRIIELFPTHSAAQMAEQRIAVLALELKRYEKGRVVKLGAPQSSE
jgi:tetratricopeptide (TPR) repeat protein